MAKNRPASPQKSPRSSRLRNAAIAVVVLIAAVWWIMSRPAAEEAEPAAEQAAGDAFAKPQLPASLEKVEGRWQRADGGYVLEILGARVGGHLEAAYFNPNPINVSRAAWMERPEGLQVFVELTDTGYPGATYMLMFDEQNQRLAGTYTQPQMQQEFQVEFVRMKE